MRYILGKNTFMPNSETLRPQELHQLLYDRLSREGYLRPNEAPTVEEDIDIPITLLKGGIMGGPPPSFLFLEEPREHIAFEYRQLLPDGRRQMAAVLIDKANDAHTHLSRYISETQGSVPAARRVAEFVMSFAGKELFGVFGALEVYSAKWKVDIQQDMYTGHIGSSDMFGDPITETMYDTIKRLIEDPKSTLTVDIFTGEEATAEEPSFA